MGCTGASDTEITGDVDDTDKHDRCNTHAYCRAGVLTNGDSCMATAPEGADSSSEQSEDGVKGLGCLTLKLWVLLCFIMDIRASTASMSPTLKQTDRDASKVAKVRSWTSILPIKTKEKKQRSYRWRECAPCVQSWCRFLSAMNICRMCASAWLLSRGCPFT